MSMASTAKTKTMSRLQQQSVGVEHATGQVASTSVGIPSWEPAYFPSLREAADADNASSKQQEQEQYGTAADAAWQQLLASQGSKQLLCSLPALRCLSASQAAVTSVEAAQREQRLQQASVMAQTAAQQQHRSALAAMLTALHSVYEDCKLCRLRLHLLQLLGPLCWVLAGWLGIYRYKEHYERDAPATELETFAADLVGAAVALAKPVLHQPRQEGHDYRSLISMVLYPPPKAVLPAVDEQSLDQQQPGDMRRCLSACLLASGKQQQYMPHLTQQHSPAVTLSCQLMQVYQVLGASARSCAAAVAAAVIAADNAGIGISSCLNFDSCPAALAEQLQHILLLGSHQVVLLLVRLGWDVLTLDSLPFGIALPIREALSRCQTHPPTGEFLLKEFAMSSLVSSCFAYKGTDSNCYAQDRPVEKVLLRVLLYFVVTEAALHLWACRVAGHGLCPHRPGRYCSHTRQQLNKCPWHQQQHSCLRWPRCFFERSQRQYHAGTGITTTAPAAAAFPAAV